MSTLKNAPSQLRSRENLFRLDIRLCLLRLLQGFVACYVCSVLAMSLIALGLLAFAKSLIPSEINADFLAGGLLFAGYGAFFGMWIPAGLYWATRSRRVAIAAACFVGAFTGAIFIPFLHEIIRTAG
jgi:hypothetical protein